MVQEKGLTIRKPLEDRAIALQEIETSFAMAVKQRDLLEQYIAERLKPGKHYYKFSEDESQKPSLTKEGAELICLPHALKGHYQWLSGPENPPLDDNPYQITMKSILEANGKFGGEGIGSASSMITKKDGTRVQRQKDPGLRHNATIKMACKSAYIAATLNSTAASEFFTQDLEEEQTGESNKVQQKEHFCSIHQTPFFMKGKMKSYAHPIKDEDGKDTGEWCHEHKEKPDKNKPKPEEGDMGDESPSSRPESVTDANLADLNFKNLGEFYATCLAHFKINKTEVDKKIAMYDLSNPGQRKKAWQEIVGIYGQKEGK